jgi:nicotinate-nucleotide adenylyltransferase
MVDVDPWTAVEAARRIGVFGGTFDPPHNGHLVVASWVRAALGLDVVLVVVAGEPWQKVGGRSVTAAADRLALVVAMCEGVDGIEACDLEVRRPGPTYTADTLRELAGPDRELFLVLGGDAAAGLPSWERVDEVRELAVPVLVDRPAVAAPPLPDGWAWQRVDVPRLDIASTVLRHRIADGLPVDGLVPSGVISCIAARGLYGGGSRPGEPEGVEERASGDRA